MTAAPGAGDRLLVVIDSRSSYADVVRRLEAEHGAEILTLDPTHDGVRVIGKVELVTRMLRPRALARLRRGISADSRVVVFGWYALPVLALQRLRLVPVPRTVVCVGIFVHDVRIRRLVFGVLRGLGSPRWNAVAFAESDREALVAAGVFRADRVRHVVYRRRGDLTGAPRVDASTSPSSSTGSADGVVEPYVFAAGYSNRDYRTFVDAVDDAPWPVRVVASATNLDELDGLADDVEVETDVPWDRYEELLAGSAVVTIPLRPGGDASGQSVLLSAMRHERPVVVTDHPAVHAYLGADYPGTVPPEDASSMREAIDRVLTDPAWADELTRRIVEARDALRDLGEMADEIAAAAATPS